MAQQEPVNVVFSRTAKPGKEKQYEELTHQSIVYARRYTGHEGATVIKEGERRYHLVYRFKNHKLLEQWLTSDKRRGKMWLATLVGAYPLVVLFQAIIAPKVQNWPLLVRSAIFPLVLLSLMTYIVMPKVTKLFKPWLYKGVDSGTPEKV
jgi:antibiotic biosynthesis monooxygenase (ABM) superfamily enzyme